MLGALTVTISIPMVLLNVSSGSYITSYSVMTPFWSMAGTGSQVTMIEVDDTAVAIVMVGGLAGTSEIRACNKKFNTLSISHHLRWS